MRMTINDMESINARSMGRGKDYNQIGVFLLSDIPQLQFIQ
jgi:hypothetical protein